MDVPPLAAGQCKPLKYKELLNTRKVAQFRQYFKGARLNRQGAHLVAGLIVAGDSQHYRAKTLYSYWKIQDFYMASGTQMVAILIFVTGGYFP